MIKDDFSSFLEDQMSQEDDFDTMFSLSEDGFGAFDNIFSTDSFNETMDNLFPCGVKEEYMQKLEQEDF
ncbi:MAG: hypothetical protein IJ193_00615 [Bacilli bacterium]|nr:hypothetical protein [Bacilli bacterium]